MFKFFMFKLYHNIHTNAKEHNKYFSIILPNKILMFTFSKHQYIHQHVDFYYKTTDIHTHNRYFSVIQDEKLPRHRLTIFLYFHTIKPNPGYKTTLSSSRLTTHFPILLFAIKCKMDSHSFRFQPHKIK